MQTILGTYARDSLAFLGITDVEFVYAEGLATGEDSKARSLEAAHRTLQSMIFRTARAA